MAGRQVKIDPGELDALLAASSAAPAVKKEEPALAEYTLVATPSKRQFHVMNFLQNDFKVDPDSTVYLTRAQGYSRKKRADMLDPSIAPYSGAHRVNRAFQPKTKAVFADKRTPEQIAEAERERYPWVMREKDGRTYEGRVGLDNVARYVMFVKSGNEIRVVPLKKWYNFQTMPQTQPMSLEEIDQLQKQHLKIIGESLSLRGKGRAAAMDDDDDDMTERRRRARQEKDEATVDEGEWDYVEQDEEILDDIGENTAANLKSGREKDFDEVDEELQQGDAVDKELKNLLKEMRDDGEESSSDSEFSFSGESDESDSDESSDGEDQPPAKAPASTKAPAPSKPTATPRGVDAPPRVGTPSSEHRKRAAEEPASSAVKKVKQEPGTPPQPGSPAPDPSLLLTQDEVRRMWRQPVTTREFMRIVNPRLKQHPQNRTLLTEFLPKLFVMRNDKLHLINP